MEARVLALPLLLLLSLVLLLQAAVNAEHHHANGLINRLRRSSAGACELAPVHPPHPEATNTGPYRGWIAQVGPHTVENLDRSSRPRNPPSPFSTPPNKFLLHTTDGGSTSGRTAGYWEGGIAKLDSNGNHFWPHFIIARDCNNVLRIGQFLPTTVACYAAERGDGSIQVEIGGDTRNPFTESDSETAVLVHQLYKVLNEKIPTIPMVSNVAFYDAGCATHWIMRNYASVAGLLGHQHVPRADHGDPGPICASFIVTGSHDACAGNLPARCPPRRRANSAPAATNH